MSEGSTQAPAVAASAVVHPGAELGAGVRVGEHCVIEEQVRIGAGTVLGHGVVVRAGTVVGENIRIDDHAVLGKLPMRSPSSATTEDKELDPLVLGDGCLIGTGAVLYRGARLRRRVLVADLATVREDVLIGDRTIVGRGVTVENRCTIGRFVKLESECYIAAYSTLEDRVFVAPGVVTSNDNFVGRTEERFLHFKGVTVRRGGRIGAGAVILPGIEIGEDALVGAGAVVTQNVPKHWIVVGSPARRFLRDVPPEQLLQNQGWSDDV